MKIDFKKLFFEKIIFLFPLIVPLLVILFGTKLSIYYVFFGFSLTLGGIQYIMFLLFIFYFLKWNTAHFYRNIILIPPLFTIFYLIITIPLFALFHLIFLEYDSSYRLNFFNSGINNIIIISCIGFSFFYVFLGFILKKLFNYEPDDKFNFSKSNSIIACKFFFLAIPLIFILFSLSNKLFVAIGLNQTILFLLLAIKFLGIYPEINPKNWLTRLTRLPEITLLLHILTSAIFVLTAKHPHNPDLLIITAGVIGCYAFNKLYIMLYIKIMNNIESINHNSKNGEEHD